VVIFGNRRIIGSRHYEASTFRGASDLMRRTLDKYPWAGVFRKVPLEEINEAFIQQDRPRSPARAIVPN